MFSLLNINYEYRHVLNDIGASAYADVFTSLNLIGKKLKHMRYKNNNL